MKILRLTSSNFKRLTAVEISPEGNMVMITGSNKQGKSSVLDSIMAALCGTKYHPDEPIHRGKDRAEIVIDIPNYKITRTFTEKTSSVKIENGEGMEAKSPQKLLTSLVGEIAFDPMHFYELSTNTKENARQQRKMLMDMVGLDFSDIDEQIVAHKEDRTLINRQKATAQLEADQIDLTEGLPEEELSIDKLTTELNEAIAFNDDIAIKAQQSEEVDRKIAEATSDLTTSDGEMARLQAEIDGIRSRSIETTRKITALEKAKKEFKPEEKKEIEAIQQSIQGVDSKNRQIRDNIEKKVKLKTVKSYSSQYAKLGKKIEQLDKDKAERLAGAEMPIEGLSVSDDGLVYNDLPLSQECESMRMKIAVAIGMKLNPKLKVILMNGDHLDSKSLAMIAEMAETNDYQVWVEKVCEDGKTGIIIENGEVQADAMPDFD